MVPESYIPPKEVRELRDLMGMRTNLVRDRTRLKARVRAELEKNRIKAEMSVFTEKGKEWLRELGIYTVDQYLPVIDILDEQVNIVLKRVKGEAGEDRDAILLTNIYEVSYFTALLVVSENSEH